TGLQKQILVSLGPGGTRVRLVHAITNHGARAVTLAPWAITILAAGGETILPQEPYRSWDEEIAPARPLVLWHYTDLRDPRFGFGTRLLRLRADETRPAPQKIGVLDRQGWAAYPRGDH